MVHNCFLPKILWVEIIVSSKIVSISIKYPLLLLYVFFHVLVVCMHVCMCWVWMHIYVQVGSVCVCVPKIDIMCLLGHPSSYLLRQGSCLNPELTCTLVEISRLVQQCCFCSLPSGILGRLPCPPNTHWSLGLQALILMFTWEALAPPSHLSSSTCS